MFLAPWAMLPLGERWAREAADRLRLGVARANARLLADERHGPRRLGTTFAGVVVCRDHVLCVGSVGDSRIYLFRPSTARLAPLTQDDTVLNVAFGRGVPFDVAAAQPRAHALTRAIGLRSTLELRPAVTRWEPGDLLLACTDGVTDPLDAAMISRALAAGDDLGVMAQQLVGNCTAAGGRDNATALLVRLAL
jgi:protein phosphatase